MAFNIKKGPEGKRELQVNNGFILLFAKIAQSFHSYQVV